MMRLARHGGGVRAVVRLAATAALALAVAACGFHLRGSYRVPEALMPIHVDAGSGSAMGDALRQALERQGAELTDDKARAGSSLAVLDESEDRRVLSVDETADVSEYEVQKSVRWQLVRPAGDGADAAAATLIAPNRLRARRDYEFDPASVLSKAQEEESLYADMEQALAQQILARLQAWSPETE
jgi:LPS-assembly lipoprotein